MFIAEIQPLKKRSAQKHTLLLVITNMPGPAVAFCLALLSHDVQSKCLWAYGKQYYSFRFRLVFLILVHTKHQLSDRAFCHWRFSVIQMRHLEKLLRSVQALKCPYNVGVNLCVNVYESIWLTCSRWSPCWLFVSNLIGTYRCVAQRV